MNISLDVFSRTGSSGTLSSRAFYGLISLFTLGGILTCTLITPLLISMGFIFSGWLGVLGFLALILIGIYIAKSSENIVYSILGYLLIILANSYLFTVLQHVSPALLQSAAIITLIIVGIMGSLGLIYPNFFSKIGTSLFISLIALIVIRIVAMFIPIINSFGIIEYGAVIIFSLYVGYDMYKSSIVERTPKNALDIAINLYIDIINIFINILSLLDD